MALGAACDGGRVLAGEEGLFRAANDLPAVIGWPVRAVMQLGDVKVAVAVCLLVAALTNRWRLAVLGIAAAVPAWWLANQVKELVGRPRPFAFLPDVAVREDPHGFAYPSGHAAVSTALVLALVAAVPARWRFAAWAVPVVVAVARLHVGVHLPGDVLGGAALGLAVGALVTLGARSRPSWR